MHRSEPNRALPLEPTQDPQQPGALEPSRQGPRKTPRVALACKRCKRRKQRCDGTHPVCRSCAKAAVPCLYERSLRPQYPGGKSLYITALEERIAFLESRIPGFSDDHFAPIAPEQAPPASVEGRTGNDALLQGRQHEPLDEQLANASPPPPPTRAHADRHGRRPVGSFSDAESPSLVDGVAYLSLRASGAGDDDADPEPYYLGSSSGAAVARMVQDSIFHSPRGRQAIFGCEATEAAPLDGPDKQAPQPSMPLSPGSFQPWTASTVFPSPDAARLLFDVFFDKLHTHWPVLDRSLYTRLFASQFGHESGVISIQQRGVLHLIYAISARFLQLTKKPCSVDPEIHLAAAIEHMDFILEQHNLGTVQFLLLLALHGQRSPYGAGAWSQVRHAVTLCIELGFHRQRRTRPDSDPSGNNLAKAEMRRRVFWAAYCLDRLTSGVLGRPYAIDDRDIDAELPRADLELWSLTGRPLAAEAITESSSSLPWSNALPFIHIVKLHRIQSRIHRRVYRVDKDVSAADGSSKLDDKMAALQRELDIWRTTVPYPPPRTGPSADRNGRPLAPEAAAWMYDPESAHLDSRDYFELQYHKSVLLLYTALLPTLDPVDQRFRTAAASAAAVCTAYKRLEQQRTLSYTMLALHSCFVAGLTLVYCCWRGGRRVFGFEALEATRACSQSLTIFGEKWPGAVKYRDIFDALSGGLLRVMMTGGGGGDGDASYLRLDGLPEPNEGRKRGDRPPSANRLVSDAVAEAFMEVDEEAPGGWHCWRMFNEMVQPEPGTVRNGLADADAPLPAVPFAGSRPRDDEPDFMATSEWDFGGLEGLS